MTTAVVKKWADFQHYKNRCPPWIKLQKSILDDFEYACLPIASKALAPLLWLLASESMDGSVRIDADWLAFRLRFSVSDIHAGITPLIDKGFLVLASGTLAPCLHDACLEGEAEAEGEGDIPNPYGLGAGISDPGAADGEKEDSQGAKDAAQPKPQCPIREIVATYHECLPTHPRCEKITKTRAGLIRQRWLDKNDLPTLEAWRNYFGDVAKSKFLTGRSDPRPGHPPFVADLEWLCRPSNFAKVMEGKYHR